MPFLLLDTHPRGFGLRNTNTGWILSDHWSTSSFDGVYTTHYGDVKMGAIASQITSFTNVYRIVYPDADQRKHQSSASLAFMRGNHRGPVKSPHKWPVTRKMFPFDYVIMILVVPGEYIIRTITKLNTTSIFYVGLLTLKNLNQCLPGFKT